MLIELHSHPTFPTLVPNSPDCKWFNWGMGAIQGKSNGKLFGNSLDAFLNSLPNPLKEISYDPSFSKYLPPPNLHYGVSPWYQSMMFQLRSEKGTYELPDGFQIEMKKGRYYIIDLNVRYRFYSDIPVEYLGVKFKTPFDKVYAICKELGYCN